jgi:hypothetical protein
MPRHWKNSKAIKDSVESMHIEGMFDYKLYMANSRDEIEEIRGPHLFVFNPFLHI